MFAFFQGTQVKTPSGGHPEVWVTATSQDFSDRTEVTSTFHRESRPHATTVNVRLPSGNNGETIADTRVFAAGETTKTSMILYYKTNAPDGSKLRYTIDAGAGYTIPHTQDRPAQVTITVGVATGTAKAIPNPDTVVYSDAPVALTDAMFVNDELTLTGLKIQSNDSMVHCIDFSNVTGSKTIYVQDCIFRQCGLAVHGAYARITVVVKNCFFFGLRGGTDVKGWGYWGVHCFAPYQATVENCYFQDIGGVQLEYNTSLQASCLGYTIRYNRAKNIYHPGGGGGSDRAAFLNVQGNGGVIPNQLIEYNEILNIPGECWVEDNLNIYNTKAPSNNPGLIRHNFVDGAHKSKTATQYTGGGFIVDGDSSTTSAEAPENWVMENNVAIRCCNYSFAVATGISCIMRNNKVVVAARFVDGTPYASWTSGIYTDDYSANKNVSNLIEVYDNNVGVVDLYGGREQDYGFHNNVASSPRTGPHTTHYNNASLPNPIDRAKEDAEITVWNTKKQNAGVVCGPKE